MKTKHSKTQLELCIELVAQAFEISVDEINMNNERTPKLSMARWFVYNIMRESSSMSLTDLADIFGQDHTTVIYALKNLKKKFNNQIDAIYQDIKNQVIEKRNPLDDLTL